MFPQPAALKRGARFAIALACLAGPAAAAEPLFTEDFRTAPTARGWLGGRFLCLPGDSYTALAAAPGPRSDAELAGRLPIPLSPSALPWLQLELAGAAPGLFSGLSVASGGVTLLRDAELAGRYTVDLSAALPALVGQPGPLQLTLGLAGATLDRPGPATHLRSLALLRSPEESLQVVHAPDHGDARWPDGVIRRGELVPVRLPPAQPEATPELTASVAGWPRRVVAITVEPARDGVCLVRLPDDLVAGPGELLFSLARLGAEPLHAPCWAAVDTTEVRATEMVQAVGRSELRPTLDGAMDDRAWRDAAVLAGLGAEARILVLAQEDGLAIAARLRRPDGQPPVSSPEGDPSDDDRLTLRLAPGGEQAARYNMAINAAGVLSERSARAAVPHLPLLGASDGGWQVELLLPWTALGDPDAEAFGLAVEVQRPGLAPSVLHWPGTGRLARLSGLGDLRPYRLPTGPPELTAAGGGTVVVELPITNRTGEPFGGTGKAAWEQPDGLQLAECPIALAPGESGRLRWEFKAGDGPRTLRWRVESPVAPVLRRTGFAAL